MQKKSLKALAIAALTTGAVLIFTSTATFAAPPSIPDPFGDPPPSLEEENGSGNPPSLEEENGSDNPDEEDAENQNPSNDDDNDSNDNDSNDNNGGDDSNNDDDNNGSNDGAILLNNNKGTGTNTGTGTDQKTSTKKQGSKTISDTGPETTYLLFLGFMTIAGTQLYFSKKAARR